MDVVTEEKLYNEHLNRRYAYLETWFEICLNIKIIITVCRDSSVGIETLYGMDGPEVELQQGQDFPFPSRPAVGPTQLPIKCAPVFFPGGKAAGKWR